jgi:hypothetical protein
MDVSKYKRRPCGCGGDRTVGELGYWRLQPRDAVWLVQKWVARVHSRFTVLDAV